MKKRVRNLAAVGIVWLVCLLAWSGFSAWLGDGIDSSVLVPAVFTGLLVMAVISQVSRTQNKLRASLTGLGIGLIPTLVGLVIGLISPKTVDAAAGWIALSLWLVVPNGVGGAIGGLTCCRSKLD